MCLSDGNADAGELREDILDINKGNISKPRLLNIYAPWLIYYMSYIHLSFTSKGLNHLFEGDIAGNVSRQFLSVEIVCQDLKKAFYLHVHCFCSPAETQSSMKQEDGSFPSPTS